MSVVRVAPVDDRSGISAFIAAGRRAEATNPRWVEPLHDEVRMTFSPRRAPFRRDNVVQPFVAFRDGEPVGRIVATIEAAHLKKFDDACGYFGFIEAVDDPAVFDALFDAAEGFLRRRGMRIVRGPFSLTINHKSGLLVAGFDEPHVVRTNHVPPHYARHIERLGYRKAMDLVAYVARVAETDAPERVARARRERRSGDPDRAPVAAHMGARFSARACALQRRLVRQRLRDAGRSGRGEVHRPSHAARLPAGLDPHRDLPRRGHGGVRPDPRRQRGARRPQCRLFPFGFAEFLWRVHVAGARRTRVAMAGVARRWRNARVAVRATAELAALAILDARKAGVEEIEFSWMLETNAAAINAARNVPARLSRTFRIYERALGLQRSNSDA